MLHVQNKELECVRKSAEMAHQASPVQAEQQAQKHKSDLAVLRRQMKEAQDSIAAHKTKSPADELQPVVYRHMQVSASTLMKLAVLVGKYQAPFP